MQDAPLSITMVRRNEADLLQQRQIKVFTNWANFKLVSKGLQINSIVEDTKDGIILLTIAEIVTGVPLPPYNKRPKLPMQRINNTAVALKHLQEKGHLRLSVTASAIVEGDVKSILSLFWLLIREYQLNRRASRPGEGNMEANLDMIEEQISRGNQYSPNSEKPAIDSEKPAVDPETEQIQENIKREIDDFVSWGDGQARRFGGTTSDLEFTEFTDAADFTDFDNWESQILDFEVQLIQRVTSLNATIGKGAEISRNDTVFALGKSRVEETESKIREAIEKRREKISDAIEREAQHKKKHTEELADEFGKWVDQQKEKIGNIQAAELLPQIEKRDTLEVGKTNMNLEDFLKEEKKQLPNYNGELHSIKERAISDLEQKYKELKIVLDEEKQNDSVWAEDLETKINEKGKELLACIDDKEKEALALAEKKLKEEAIEREKELERKKEKERELEKEKEQEQARELHLGQERQKELERQQELEREQERARELEKEKELEREKERQKELEREKERARELENEKELEREKERQKELERQKDLERQKQELEKEREKKEKELEKERLKNEWETKNKNYKTWASAVTDKMEDPRTLAVFLKTPEELDRIHSENIQQKKQLDDFWNNEIVKATSNQDPSVNQGSVVQTYNSVEDSLNNVNEKLKNAIKAQQEIKTKGSKSVIVAKNCPVGHESELCKICSKMLRNGVVVLVDETDYYHYACFICYDCGETFDTFYWEYEDKPYCEKHYAIAAGLICAYCKDYIPGKVVRALGKNWHIKCLNCTTCKKSLMSVDDDDTDDEQLFSKDGLPYCDYHYYKEEGLLCARCDKPIGSGDKSALGKVWHKTCWFCTKCGNSFESKGFFNVEGQPFCSSCKKKNKKIKK